MTDDTQRKLVLTEDDFGPEEQVAAPAVGQAPPPAPPATAAVGEPLPALSQRPRVELGGGGSAHPLNLGDVRTRSVVAASVAVAIGWAICELTGIGLWETTSKSGANFASAAYVGVLGLTFAIVYAGWEHIEARSLEGLAHVAGQVALIGAALGFAAGFVAQLVYTPILEGILRDATFEDFEQISGNAKLYFARALAWGLFGAGMGVAGAALVRSREKLLNGLIGGAIGGAIGGVVFHWVAFNVDSLAFSRLIGLLVVGAGIGLAIGLVETARREAWLHVVGGGMAGKEFILYADETKVGSSPKCDIVLIKDDAIQPYHFVIASPRDTGVQRRVLTPYQGCVVTVNGQSVSQHELRAGDVIGVGSTSIEYAERATAHA